MSWGNKETLIERVESGSEHKCLVCNVESTFQYRLFQKSVTIFGLSLFPTTKLIKSVCGNCGVTKQLKRSKSSNNVMDSGEVDELLNVSYNKLKFYSALIMLFLLVAIVYYAFFMK